MSRYVVVVTGDRHATGEQWGMSVAWALSRASDKSDGRPVLIVGDAPGIDEIAQGVGDECGYSVVECVAQWGEYANRRAAGPKRNQNMLAIAAILNRVGYTPIVLAFHDKLFTGSRGTRDCVEQAIRAGLPAYRVERSLSMERITLPDRPQLRLV